MSAVFQSEYPNIQIVKDAVMKAKYHTDVYDCTSSVKGPDLFVAQVFLGSVRLKATLAKAGSNSIRLV